MSIDLLVSMISNLGIDNVYAMLGLEDTSKRMIVGILLFMIILYLKWQKPNPSRGTQTMFEVLMTDSVAVQTEEPDPPPRVESRGTQAYGKYIPQRIWMYNDSQKYHWDNSCDHQRKATARFHSGTGGVSSRTPCGTCQNNYRREMELLYGPGNV